MKYNLLPEIISLSTKFKIDISHVDINLSNEEFQKQKSKQLEYSIKGAAIGIVVLNDYKLVLTKRSGPHSGWALPGGRIELSEGFEEGFVREVKEETDLDIKINGVISIEEKTFNSPSGEKIAIWLVTFISSVINDGIPRQTSEAISEGLEISVFEQDDLPLEIVATDKIKILNYIVSRK